jgi:hypothetical protein
VNDNSLLNEFTIFVLAIFIGFEVISKVPTILHTPLMSGTNAIHGIILVGNRARPAPDRPGPGRRHPCDDQRGWGLRGDRPDAGDVQRAPDDQTG